MTYSPKLSEFTIPLNEEGDLRADIEQETLRVFNERSVFGAYSAIAGIALALGVIWAASGWLLAFIWTLGMLLVELGILFVGVRCREAVDGRGDPMRWKTAQLVLTGVTGVSWGMLPWFVGAGQDFYMYLGSIMLFVGVSGVGMVAMSAYMLSTSLFFGGIYLVPMVHVLLHPSELGPFLIAGLLMILVVQITYSRELRALVRRDIEQSVRNAALVSRLEDLVIHDQLTGAYSRSYLMQQMEQQVARRRRHGDSACVIMIDLDHFKAVNDSYGHPTGDRVLVHAVQQILQQLRDGDVLSRVGGEEFMVLLPSTNPSDAVQIAERLRRVLAEAWVSEGPARIHMPASLGVAELQSTESHSEWFRRADQALYDAKAQGRNRVVVAPATAPTHSKGPVTANP